MNRTEVFFFALAFLIPLFGGGALLYFITSLSKENGARGDGARKDGDEDKKEK